MMTQETPEESKYISTGHWGVALEKFVDPSKTVCVVWRPFCPKGIPRVRVINREENKEFNNRDELQAFIAKLNLAADQAWPQQAVDMVAGETGMKLIDELQGVERDNALPEWPNTLKRLSDLMPQRANKQGYGAILVGVHSKQVEMMLREWATGEGLNVQEGGSMFTRAIWLVWGIAPVMSCGCDVEVMANGKLVIHERY